MSETKCYKFTEYNSWEGERWNFFIDMTEEQHERLKGLLKGNSAYQLSDKDYSSDEVNTLIENAQLGYLWTDSYLGYLTGLPENIDWKVEDPFYKGRIEDFCKYEDYPSE